MGSRTVSKETAENSIYRLNPTEESWRDRQELFANHGYQLRPRYRTGWTPSWIGTSLNPIYCEDSISLIWHQFLDARAVDGTSVAIKRVKHGSAEIDIARYLSSEDLLSHPRNHSVHILDCFQDAIEPEISYLVMPLLRPFNDPEFGVIGEVMDFVGQVLEGLTFLHSHSIAHRDCTGLNIMMDGRPLYPNGWHPIRRNYTPNGAHPATPLARIDHAVRYYFIDYGISVRFRDDEPRLMLGCQGIDQDVPELSHDIPYDPFKVDVFILGNVFKKEFYQKYMGLAFLDPLIRSMMVENPRRRSTADSALTQWFHLRITVSQAAARWRLRKPDETVPERVLLDTVAVAREGLHNLKRLVN